MKVFTSASSRRRAILVVVAFVVALAGSYLALREFAPFVFDAEEFRTWIDGFGVYAPIVFVAAQAVQVIVAPVPGQITALVGGYIFGPVGGTVYSMIGVLIGSAIAFSIAKRWGRPAVERMIHEDLIDRFDGFVREVGKPGLLLFVVIPGLPDDAICFLAGLTPFRLATFVSIMVVGRLPAYIVTNFAGGELATGNLIEAVVAIAAVVCFSAFAYLKRDEIQRYVRGT